MLLASLIVIILAFNGMYAKEFAIDYEHDSFTMDGQPFQYVSGSMHYFRCPRQYWRDRLRKMRDAGLNAVSTYIEWSQHEKIPGEYDFSGDLDFEEFIRTAAEEGLYVILRPGPYICAERDMGGLPPWLLRDPHIQLRTMDPRYTGPVERWLDVLLAKLAPKLYGNGGPIIMVQVENEYGSYFACDGEYLLWLRDLFHKHVRGQAVLFTTDGAAASFLKCGKIPGIYATVDFGSSSNVTAAFASQRRTEPRGPLVNSEYYPGWLTHWGESLQRVDSHPVQQTLREMLARKANVNFYMFYGGSNFAFTAGANYGTRYQSDITSYDYDAPLTEAGDLTFKYHAIKQVLAEYFPERVRNQTYPDNSKKGDYGSIELTNIASLLSPAVRRLIGQSATANYPLTFETLASYYGYVLYEADVPAILGENVIFKTNFVGDRAVILQDNQRVAALSREYSVRNASFVVKSPKLSVIVENLGRVNYGTYNNDSKGLGNVTVNHKRVVNWNMTAFSLESVKKIISCSEDCLANGGFQFFAASFIIENNTTDEFLSDTYLDVSPLKKGLIFINDRNLGRYWPTRGPQMSLYVPGIWLNKAPRQNTIVILDEKLQNNTITVRFSTQPIWSVAKKKVQALPTVTQG